MITRSLLVADSAHTNVGKTGQDAEDMGQV